MIMTMMLKNAYHTPRKMMPKPKDEISIYDNEDQGLGLGGNLLPSLEGPLSPSPLPAPTLPQRQAAPNVSKAHAAAEEHA